MNKNILIFLGGLAVGTAGTILWVVKKLIPELKEDAMRRAQEELYTFPDYSEYLSDEDKEKEKKAENDIPAASEVKEKVQANRAVPAVDYSRYAADPKKETEKNPERKDPENIPKPEADTEQGVDEPYLIDVSEYDIRGDYKAHAYTIYANGVVVDDDTDETVNLDPLETFGKTAMKELDKEELVYVRDEAKKIDYRVEMSDFKYEEPEDDDDDWGP